jgi:hypothetical protein
VAKAELNIFEPAAVGLDNPVGDRVAKRVWRDVVGFAGPPAGDDANPPERDRRPENSGPVERDRRDSLAKEHRRRRGCSLVGTVRVARAV